MTATWWKGGKRGWGQGRGVTSLCLICDCKMVFVKEWGQANLYNVVKEAKMRMFLQTQQAQKFSNNAIFKSLKCSTVIPT